MISIEKYNAFIIYLIIFICSALSTNTIIAMDKKPLSADLKKRYQIAIKNLTKHTIYLTVDNGDQQEDIFQIFPNTDKIEIFSVPLQNRPMVKVILSQEHRSSGTYLPMLPSRVDDYFIIKHNAINPQCIDIKQATNEQLKEAYQ